MISISEIIKQASKAVIGKTSDAAIGQKVVIGQGKNAVTATAITPIRFGDAIAMQAVDGQWYAFQANDENVKLSNISVNQTYRKRKKSNPRKYVFLLAVNAPTKEYYVVSNADITRVAGLFDYENGKGDVKISFFEDTNNWVICGWQKYKANPSHSIETKVRLQFVSEENNETEDTAFASGEFAGAIYDYNTFIENTDDGALHHFPHCVAHNGRWAVIETGYCATLQSYTSPPKVIATRRNVAIVSFYDGEAFVVEAPCNPAGNRIYAQAVPFRINYRSYFTGTNHQEFRIDLHEYTHEETFFISKNTTHTNRIVVREVLDEGGEYNRFTRGFLAYREEHGVISSFQEYIKPSKYLHGFKGTVVAPLDVAGLAELKLKCDTTLHCKYRHIVYTLHEQTTLRSRPIVNDNEDHGISFVYTAQVDTFPFNKIAYTVFANYIVDVPTSPPVAKKYFCEYWYYQDKFIRTLEGAFTLGGVFPVGLPDPVFSAGKPRENDYINITDDPDDYPMGYYTRLVRPPSAPDASHPVPPDQLAITLNFSNFTFIKNAGLLRSRKDRLEEQNTNFFGFVGTFVDRDGAPTLDPDKKDAFWYHSIGGFFANREQRQAFNYPVARFKAEGYIIYQQEEEHLIDLNLLYNGTLGIFDVPAYRTLTPVPLPFPNLDLTLEWGVSRNNALPLLLGSTINLGDIAALRINFSVDAPMYRTPFPYAFNYYTPPSSIPDSGSFTFSNFFASTQNYHTPDAVIDDQILVHVQRKLFATFVPPVVDDSLNIRAIDILLYNILTFQVQSSIPELPSQAFAKVPIRNFEMRMTNIFVNPSTVSTPKPPTAKQMHRPYDQYPIEFWAVLLNVTLPVEGGTKYFGYIFETPNEIALLRPRTDLFFANASFVADDDSSIAIANCPIELLPRYVTFTINPTTPPTVVERIYPDSQFNDRLSAVYSVFNPYLNSSLMRIGFGTALIYNFNTVAQTPPLFDAIILPVSPLPYPFAPAFTSFDIYDYIALTYYESLPFRPFVYMIQLLNTSGSAVTYFYLSPGIRAFPPIYHNHIFPPTTPIPVTEGQIGKSSFYFSKPVTPDTDITQIYLFQDLNGQKFPVYYVNVAPVNTNMPSSNRVVPNWMTNIDITELSQFQGAIRPQYTFPSSPPYIYYLTPLFIPPYHFTTPRLRNDTARSDGFLAITTRIGTNLTRDDIELPYFNNLSLTPINELPSSAKLLWKAFSVKIDA